MADSVVIDKRMHKISYFVVIATVFLFLFSLSLTRNAGGLDVYAVLFFFAVFVALAFIFLAPHSAFGGEYLTHASFSTSLRLSLVIKCPTGCGPTAMAWFLPMKEVPAPPSASKKRCPQITGDVGSSTGITAWMPHGGMTAPAN